MDSFLGSIIIEEIQRFMTLIMEDAKTAIHDQEKCMCTPSQRDKGKRHLSNHVCSVNQLTTNDQMQSLLDRYKIRWRRYNRQ